MVKTWALVAYTLLTQMSVGTFLVYWLSNLASRRSPNVETERQVHRPLPISAMLLVVGMVVSLFHLGRPLMAYRAVVNVSNSWLSREILFMVLYGVLGLLYIGAVRGRLLAGLRSVLGWLVSLSGIGLIYSMSKIYMIEAVPSWNTPATPVAFFVAALLLGGFITGAAYLSGSGQTGARARIVGWIGIGSILLLGLQVGAMVLTGDLWAVGSFSGLTVAYLVLSFLGAGVCTTLLYGESLKSSRSSSLATLTYAAFVLVLAAQVVHRYLFYVNEIRIGL